MEQRPPPRQLWSKEAFARTAAEQRRHRATPGYSPSNSSGSSGEDVRVAVAVPLDAVDRLLAGDECLVDNILTRFSELPMPDSVASANALERSGSAGWGQSDQSQTSFVDTSLSGEDDTRSRGTSFMDTPLVLSSRLSSSRHGPHSAVYDTSNTWFSRCDRCRAHLAAPGLSAVNEYYDEEIPLGLRVRVTSVESPEANARYVLRVDDSMTAQRWEVRKTAKEMSQFYHQVRQIGMDAAPTKKELWGTFRSLRCIQLPYKFLQSRGKLVYQRSVVFDSLLRQVSALASPVPLGPRRRLVIRLLHKFIGVAEHYEVIPHCLCPCATRSGYAKAAILVRDVFARNPNHSVHRECERFVHEVTQKAHASRRSKMLMYQALGFLHMICEKMSAVRQTMLQDSLLVQRVGRLRESNINDTMFDDFVDDVRRATLAFVQRAILIQLEDHVSEALHVVYSDPSQEKAIENQHALQTRSQSFFGIPERLQAGDEWSDARAELREIDHYSLPIDKMRCILRASSAIYQQVAKQGPRGYMLATDEFLPIHNFVVVKSNVSSMLQTLQLLRLTCDPGDLTGEMGYYFTYFEAAIKLIMHYKDRDNKKALSVASLGSASISSTSMP